MFCILSDARRAPQRRRRTATRWRWPSVIAQLHHLLLRLNALTRYHRSSIAASSTRLRGGLSDRVPPSAGRAGGISISNSRLSKPVFVFLLPPAALALAARFLPSLCAFPSPLPFAARACCSFCNLEKNFCACDRICTAVFVPMCASIFLHARPYFFNDSTNNACSSSLHFSRFFVMVYGFLTFTGAASCAAAASTVVSVPVPRLLRLRRLRLLRRRPLHRRFFHVSTSPLLRARASSDAHSSRAEPSTIDIPTTSLLKKSKKAPNPPSVLFRPPARADASPSTRSRARASTGERARRTIHERRFSLDFPSSVPRASRVARRSRVEIHPLASGFSRRGKTPRNHRRE